MDIQVITAIFAVGAIGGYYFGRTIGINTEWAAIRVDGDRHHIFKSGKTFKETQDMILDLVHELDVSKDYNAYHSGRIEQLEELVFNLTDLMHDPKVFDVFTKDELCSIYRDARMVSRYVTDPKPSIRDIEAMNKKLKATVLSRLHPKNSNSESQSK